MKQTPAFLLLAVGMFLFGSASPVSKLVSEYFPLMAGSALRVFAGALILSPFLPSGFRTIKELPGAQKRRLLYLSFFGAFAFSILLMLGMKHISGVMGSIILSLTPGLTGVGAYIFLREKLGAERILGLILCIVGVLLLSFQDAATGNSSLLGATIILGAVLCEVAYVLFGKELMKDIDPLPLAAISAWLGMLFFLPSLLFTISDINLAEVETEGWFYLLWWGVGAMGLGSMAWYKGLKQVEGSVAAGFTGIMPVAGMVLSYWLLNEKFHWLHAIGIVVVTAGVLLTAYSQSK